MQHVGLTPQQGVIELGPETLEQLGHEGSSRRGEATPSRSSRGELVELGDALGAVDQHKRLPDDLGAVALRMTELNRPQGIVTIGSQQRVLVFKYELVARLLGRQGGG